jgi:hypothetical protein
MVFRGLWEVHLLTPRTRTWTIWELLRSHKANVRNQTVNVMQLPVTVKFTVNS